MTAIDTNYQLQPGESVAQYTARIASYDTSQGKTGAAAAQAGIATATPTRMPSTPTTVTTPPTTQPPAPTTQPPTSTYTPGYYKDPTSGAFYQKGADGSVSIVSNGDTYNQLKSGAITATAAPYTNVAATGKPVAPAPVSNIGSVVSPPNSGTGTPPTTTGSAPTIADQFNTSLAATIAAQTKQLQDALTTQQQHYQNQIDALNAQSEQYQRLQEAGLANENSTIQQEATQKQAALDQEQQQFQQNYQARQQLTDQLTTLLTTGQQVIEGMKATTGLASIMNPRISQTMTDVQAQAGVITAALSAYSDQIGLAQSQLSSATAAITSIYSDQIDYWKNVVSFYNDQQKSTDAKAAKLSADEKTYVDAQIQILQDKVTSTQKTADAIQQAMLDPKTAMDYAKAGVTLTDSPEQISKKLATYETAQQNVWSAPKLVGGDYIQTNKLTGETRTVVSNVSTGGGTGGGGAPSASSANSKGKLSSKQFVELSLQRAGLNYVDTLKKVPAGKVGVVDNATGQVGYIDPTEYNTKQYTYL